MGIETAIITYFAISSKLAIAAITIGVNSAISYGLSTVAGMLSKPKSGNSAGGTVDNSDATRSNNIKESIAAQEVIYGEVTKGGGYFLP